MNLLRAVRMAAFAAAATATPVATLAQSTPPATPRNLMVDDFLLIREVGMPSI